MVIRDFDTALQYRDRIGDSSTVPRIIVKIGKDHIGPAFRIIHIFIDFNHRFTGIRVN